RRRREPVRWLSATPSRPVRYHPRRLGAPRSSGGGQNPWEPGRSPPSWRPQPDGPGPWRAVSEYRRAREPNSLPRLPLVFSILETRIDAVPIREMIGFLAPHLAALTGAAVSL